MIYLDNKTNTQECWIPRNDGLGSVHKSSYQEGYEDGFASGETHQKNLLSSITFTENGEYARENGWSAVTVDVPQTGSTATLEEKSVSISADTTVVLPSSGFDGMSAVTIDASEYAQSNYEGGFEDGYQDGFMSGSSEGFESGYTSGHTDGVNDQKALLSTTAFTENGSYSNENGWSGVSVNIDTASTYNSGYTSGYTSGHTDGVSEEKEKLSATTFTANTAVTVSDGGYSAITVNVPQTGHTDQELEEAYQSGHTEGMLDQKELLVSTALTENGSYSRENGWNNVNVNVDTASTYQSGYTSGHSQGMADQKALLVSTAFTENGSYSRENGFSSVSVNVDTASTYQSGYTSGYTDGYDSGYTSGNTDGYSSGETHQKGLLTTTAFTENGNYSRENGWSGVSVNIDTASTYNSGYTDGYESGYTSGYTSGETYGYGKGYNSGYTTGYTSGYTKGAEDQKYLLAVTAFTENGEYTRENGWKKVTVEVQTGSSATLGVGSFSANGTYSASTDNLDGYSAITINVTDKEYRELEYLSTTGATWFELDHRFTTGEKIDVENATISQSAVSFSHQQLIAGGGGEWIRIAMSDLGLYSSYYDDNKLYGNPILLDISKSHLLLENGEFYVDDVLYTTGGPYTTGVTQSTNMVVFANTNRGGDSVSNQTASIGRITIYGSDDSIVAQYIPCLDSGNTVCFYNPISDTYIYKSTYCSGTPIAGPFAPSEDYLSGYTDGKNYQKSLLTTTAITDNGTYTRNNGYSAITVNVPSYRDVFKNYVEGSDLLITIPQGTSKIRQYCFQNQKIFTGVSIPDSVTQIETYAFDNCTGMTGTLTIPSGVTEIGYAAFYNCSGFTQLDLSNANARIGNNAFKNCKSLTAITGTTNITTIGSDAFCGCTGIIGSVVLPNLTSIGDEAFFGCSGITSVSIGVNNGGFDYVIGEECFFDCSSLSTLIMGNVFNIKRNAFGNCNNIFTIYCYRTDPPMLVNVTEFCNVRPYGTFHYPVGCDDYYESFKQYLPSTWTFVGDL